MATLGAESSQAQWRNVALQIKLKEKLKNVGIFLTESSKVPQHYGHSLFEFNLHHEKWLACYIMARMNPMLKHPDLEGDRDTRALCQRLHSIRLDEDHIDKPLTCKRTSLLPMSITLRTTTLASCS